MRLHSDDEPRMPGRFSARWPDWLDLSWETFKDWSLVDDAKRRNVDVPSVHAWIQDDWASIQLAEERKQFWRNVRHSA